MRRSRTYEEKDWPRICEVHDLARKEELRLAGLENAFLPLTIAAEREGLFDYEILVCEENGVVAGFAAFTEEELAWLYVHPDYSRRGIGRELASQALKRMPKGEKTVEVLLGNEPARSLYRSMGFTKETILSGQMPGNEAYAVSVYQMTMETGE